MQIHLSKPGGQKEGPFTVDQINRDLASQKYNDADYWAWYDGLEAWIPLHSVPGVKTGVGGATEFIPKQEEQYAIPTEVMQAPDQSEEIPSEPEPVSETEPVVDAPEPATELAAPGAQSKIYSDMASQALEHIFVFTSGEGPALRESGITAMMMLEIIGENPDAVRERVPRDVFGRCNIGDRIRTEGKVPASAWRAMSSLRPDLVERAKAGSYRTCVRTFRTEIEDLVAVFLCYNKEKL
jgi:hypothetical protein